MTSAHSYELSLKLRKYLFYFHSPVNEMQDMKFIDVNQILNISCDVGLKNIKSGLDSEEDSA